MALTRLAINGYASVELNRVSFSKTGRVIADLPLAEAFDEDNRAEAGMLLAYDYAKGEVSFPVDADEALLGIHYTTEKEYYDHKTGLNTFSLKAGLPSKYSGRSTEFGPRLGILSVGERITTNCIAYEKVEGETGDFADDDALKAAVAAAGTTPVYGYACENGAIHLTLTAPTTEKVVLQVEKATTVPNGDYGVKLFVIKA